MNFKDWLFGESPETTAQKQEMLRHELYQSIQSEADRHNKETEKLVERFRKLYESFCRNEKSDENFREALECLCSYYYEWCRHNDAGEEIERRYDNEFNEIFYESLPLIHKIAYKMENRWKLK